MMKLQHHQYSPKMMSSVDHQATGWMSRNQIEKVTMFDSSPSSLDGGSKSRSKGNQELNQQLQIKADELKRLFSAHKLRAYGEPISPGLRSQMGDVQLDAATKELERRQMMEGVLQLDVAAERMRSVVEYDSNMLLKMVDNLEHNLKQSQAGSDKGDFYERYMKLRDAKLKEQKGVKGIPKRMMMRAIEDSFEESWARMKEQFDVVAESKDVEKERASDSASEPGKISQKETRESFEEDQARNSQETLSSDEIFNDESSKILLNTASDSSSTRPTWQPESSIVQTPPNSELRKQNVKPPTGLRKANTPLVSKNARSKNIMRDALVSEDENTPRSNSTKNSSADNLQQLIKELPLVNPNSPSHVPLRVPNGQSKRSIPNRFKNNGEVKPFLRRGTGRGAGAGGSVAKLRSVRTSEAQKKENELDDSAENQESKPELDQVESEEPVGRRPKVSSSPFQFESDNEEERPSQESENSGDLESETSGIPDSATHGDNSACQFSETKSSSASTNVEGILEEIAESWTFKSRPSISDVQDVSDIEDSSNTTVGNEWSRSSHHPNLMNDAAQAKIQWQNAVKPNLDGISSDQPIKDVATGFKRLLNFRKKNKAVENTVNVSESTPKASKHDDQRENAGDSAKQSTDELRNLRIGCLSSAYAGLYEGKIFPEQAQFRRLQAPESPKSTKNHHVVSSPKASRSLFSFPSFRRRGNETKA